MAAETDGVVHSSPVFRSLLGSGQARPLSGITGTRAVRSGGDEELPAIYMRFGMRTTGMARIPPWFLGASRRHRDAMMS